MASQSVSLPPDDPSSHSGRNSSKLLQKTRVLNRNSLSNAQKASRSLRLLSDHAKAEELVTALDVLLAHHSTELEDFAKEHNTKLDHILRLVSLSSHYKKKRAVNIQNAKLHVKSLEVNGGTHTFQHFTLI